MTSSAPYRKTLSRGFTSSFVSPMVHPLPRICPEGLGFRGRSSSVVSGAAGGAGDMEKRSAMTGLGFSSSASFFFSSFCSPSFLGSDLSAAFVCFWMASLSCFFFSSTLPVVVAFSSPLFWSRAMSAMVDSKLSLSSATPPVMIMRGGRRLCVLLAFELLSEDDGDLLCPLVHVLFPVGSGGEGQDQPPSVRTKLDDFREIDHHGQNPPRSRCL